MNEHASGKWKEVGRFYQAVKLLFLLSATKRQCFSLKIKPVPLRTVWSHAGKVWSCGFMSHMRTNKVNGTRAQKWHRGDQRGWTLPELIHCSWVKSTRERRRQRSARGERERSWRWKPREAVVSHHRRLRNPVFRTHGESRRVEFGSVEKVQRLYTMVINGSHLNSSSPDPSDTVLNRPPWVTTTLGCFLIFTIVVDILGNLLVIFSVYRNKKLRNAGEWVESRGETALVGYVRCNGATLAHYSTGCV